MITNRVLLRLIVSISFAAASLLCALSLLYFSPAFTQLIIKNTELEAVRMAEHLREILSADAAVSMTSATVPPGFRRKATRVVKEDPSVVKIKLFAPNGQTIFSSADTDMGVMNEHPYFHRIVAGGKVYTKVVKKENKSLEGQVYPVDVVETYVPVMDGRKFIGAFEIYLDITAEKRELSKRLFWLNGLMLTIAGGLLTAMLVISWRVRLNFIAQENAERKILEQSQDLLEKNNELSMINDVSRVLGTSIDMTVLLPKILQTVVERLAVLRIMRKGGIFIVNGEKLELVAHLGHDEDFLRMHENLTTDDCLCGLAARTGELITSQYSHGDSRHTICYHGMPEHAHLIVPLTSGARVMGVLFLYLPPGVTIGETYLSLLRSLGNQIGMAIDNARLYEETKQLSLHDPLTGLANRRHLDLNLQHAMSQADRYGKPLSIAILDIDLFKQYNDSRGHAAGDQLLIKVAKLICDGRRDSDLAARFGGDEFLLILPETDLAGAQEVTERIRLIIAEQCEVTVSVGLAVYRPEMSQEQFIKAADAALYRAKERGRDRIECSE